MPAFSIGVTFWRRTLGGAATALALVLLLYRKEIDLKGGATVDRALLASFFAALVALVIREYWHWLPGILVADATAGLVLIVDGSTPYGVILGLCVGGGVVALVPVAKKRLLS